MAPLAPRKAGKAPARGEAPARTVVNPAVTQWLVQDASVSEPNAVKSPLEDRPQGDATSATPRPSKTIRRRFPGAWLSKPTTRPSPEARPSAVAILQPPVYPPLEPPTRPTPKPEAPQATTHPSPNARPPELTTRPSPNTRASAVTRWLPEQQRPVGPSVTSQPAGGPRPVNWASTSQPAAETGPGPVVIRWPLGGPTFESNRRARSWTPRSRDRDAEIDADPAQPQSPTAPEPATANRVANDLEPARAEAAVRAYCRVLCVSVEWEQAVRETLAALEDAGGSSTVGQDRLLSITRRIAGAHAHAPAGAERPDRCNVSPLTRCEATTVHLAARANDELDPDERSGLEEHLDSCLPCQATVLRIGRAERAFTTLAAGSGRHAVFQTDEPWSEQVERQ